MPFNTTNRPSGMSWHTALKLGLAAGFIHHFVIQYPIQADIFTTMYAFIGGNITFYVHTLSFKECFVFALIYVFTFHIMLTQLSTSFLLKILYNVYFRHRGIPTKFLWAATDFSYWNSYRGGQSHKEIEHLHKALGG